MIDLNALREQTEKIIASIKRKDPDFEIEKLVSLDKLVRQLKIEIETLRNQKNELSKLGHSSITQEIKDQSKNISSNLKNKESELENIERDFTGTTKSH